MSQWRLGSPFRIRLSPGSRFTWKWTHENHMVILSFRDALCAICCSFCYYPVKKISNKICFDLFKLPDCWNLLETRNKKLMLTDLARIFCRAWWRLQFIRGIYLSDQSDSSGVQWDPRMRGSVSQRGLEWNRFSSLKGEVFGNCCWKDNIFWLSWVRRYGPLENMEEEGGAMEVWGFLQEYYIIPTVFNPAHDQALIAESSEYIAGINAIIPWKEVFVHQH